MPEGRKLQKCNQPCEKTLDCGHLCKLKCHEKCDSVKCREPVDLKPGKHGLSIKGPCYIAANSKSCVVLN